MRTGTAKANACSSLAFAPTDRCFVSRVHAAIVTSAIDERGARFVSYKLLLSEKQLRQAHAIIKGTSVPSMPDVVIKLSREVERPDANAHKVAELISSDITLAGNVLRLANSAIYRRSAEILSIEHATMMLELTNLKSLVITSAFKHAMSSDNADYRHMIEDSQTVAHCASGIAAAIAARGRLP